MILFTILPMWAAASGFVLVHLLLAGRFAYALARTLRMNVAGSMLAAVAYEFNGFIYWRNLCCSPYAQVMAWLPLAILGAELAIRSSSGWIGASGGALVAWRWARCWLRGRDRAPTTPCSPWEVTCSTAP